MWVCIIRALRHIYKWQKDPGEDEGKGIQIWVKTKEAARREGPGIASTCEYSLWTGDTAVRGWNRGREKEFRHCMCALGNAISVCSILLCIHDLNTIEARRRDHHSKDVLITLSPIQPYLIRTMPVCLHLMMLQHLSMPTCFHQIILQHLVIPQSLPVIKCLHHNLFRSPVTLNHPSMQGVSSISHSSMAAGSIYRDNLISMLEFTEFTEFTESANHKNLRMHWLKQ